MSQIIGRAPSGIPGLDELLGGGFPQGRTIMVIGEPGSGKTILSSQFLINGMEAFGENGAFVSLKDSRHFCYREMQMFGWNFSTAEKNGKFAFVDVSPVRAVPSEVKVGKLTIGKQDFSLVSLVEAMLNSVKTVGASRIVVDSLSMLELQYPDANQRRKALLDLIEAIADTGATALVTTDFTSIGLEPWRTLEDFLRFSIIHFEKQFFHGVISMQTLPAGRV
jgi:KaiC/GvpD/RAD55 family RecA-like ATPase